MSRPQKNNADYFPHSTGLRNHRKVKMLKNKFGNVLGYAFWCLMLEWLTEQDGLEWEYSEIEIEMFASELGIDASEIPPMIEYSIKIELLFISADGFIFSDSLNDVLTPVFDKRDKEREKSKTRQRRVDGSFLPTEHGVTAVETTTPQDETVAETPQSKVKKSKEEKSKKELSVPMASDGTYSSCLDLYNDFIINQTGIPPPIDGLSGKSMKKIISHLGKSVKGENEKSFEIPNALKFVFANYELWDKYHQGQLKLNQIESNFLNIINAIKNGKSNTKNQHSSAIYRS